MLLDLPRDVIANVKFAVWLALDFVSTPFALKPQLEIPPIPLRATYVRLMMMSRMKTCSLSLHAPSDNFSPQEVCLLIFHRQDVSAFLRQENNKLHELVLLYEQTSSHTS